MPDGFATVLADDCVLVEVARARGSTPREAGAWMLVSRDGAFGTIGGGQLEYMAIDEARALLARGGAARRLDIPLGPGIGQCCGGRVALALARLDRPGKAAVQARRAAARAARPGVLVFGAGHVGRALAAALAPLPLRAALIDSRAAELALGPAGVEKRLCALPEAQIRAARPGDAFVILTHDHALDFLLAQEALARGDAGYVGMIGSRTKRAAFDSWRRGTGAPEAETPLICPIAAAGRGDKRPAVIAAFAAAEIVAALAGAPALSSLALSSLAPPSPPPSLAPAPKTRA